MAPFSRLTCCRIPKTMRLPGLVHWPREIARCPAYVSPLTRLTQGSWALAPARCQPGWRVFRTMPAVCKNQRRKPNETRRTPPAPSSRQTALIGCPEAGPERHLPRPTGNHPRLSPGGFSCGIGDRPRFPCGQRSILAFSVQAPPWHRQASHSRIRLAIRPPLGGKHGYAARFSLAACGRRSVCRTRFAG